MPPISINFQSFEGLKRVVDETRRFDTLVGGIYNITARDIFGEMTPSKMAIFAYGSPGRIELIGGDSDADLFLAEERNTVQTRDFRSLLVQRLEEFDFSKIDMPEWGDYQDIEIFLDKSLVEGNQVIETRFLAGDPSVADHLENQKNKYNTVERALKNFIFNRLYFNNYFRNKTRNGNPNIKYCSGGSRELLFLSWNDALDRIIAGESEETTYQPRASIALERLVHREIITKEEFASIKDAINFSIIFRSDMLRANRNSPDKGLTFLDNPTLERLRQEGYPDLKVTRDIFYQHKQIIEGLAQKLFDDVIRKASHLRGRNWETRFRTAVSKYTSEKERAQINEKDSLINLGLIWGANESNQKSLFEDLSRRYQGTEDWAIIGSLADSPLCPSEVLHSFAEGIAREKGYGYLLRVISRNKNVWNSTLKLICEDPNLEKRYTEVAKTVLENGKSATQNMV